MNPSSFAPEHFPPVRPTRNEELSQSGVHHVDYKKQPADQQKNLRAIHDRFAAIDDTYGNADYLDDVTARPLEKHSDDDTHARAGNLQEIQNRFDALDRQHGGLNTFDRDFGRPPVRRPPPLPLSRTPSEREHGQSTFIRNNASNSFDTSKRVTPFMKDGVIDQQTREFFAQKRQIAEKIYERLRTAGAEIKQAEYRLVQAKQDLRQATELAHTLDQGKAFPEATEFVELPSSDLIDDEG